MSNGIYFPKLCACGTRVGTHSFTHQYKLPVNFSTNSTSGGSTCIEHQIYHFSGLSFIAEDNFTNLYPTVILLEKMGAKQGCWNGHSSAMPDKVYHNALFNCKLLYNHTQVIHYDDLCKLNYTLVYRQQFITVFLLAVYLFLTATSIVTQGIKTKCRGLKSANFC